MIIEKLTRLDGRKRISAAVVAVLVVAGICYLAVARVSVVKLQAAQARHSNVQALYEGTEDQPGNLLDLQKQLEDSEKQLREQQEQCFSSEDAAEFFENISSMARAYNLRPISRVISEPRKLVVNRVGTENLKSEKQLLKQQSAEAAVSGNYSDIVDFVTDLVDRPQQVCITELHVALPAGEKFNPKASFKVTLFIDSSKEDKQ